MIATYTDMTKEQVVEMLREDEEYEVNKSFNKSSNLIGTEQIHLISDEKLD